MQLGLAAGEGVDTLRGAAAEGEQPEKRMEEGRGEGGTPAPVAPGVRGMAPRSGGADAGEKCFGQNEGEEVRAVREQDELDLEYPETEARPLPSGAFVQWAVEMRLWILANRLAWRF